RMELVVVVRDDVAQDEREHPKREHDPRQPLVGAPDPEGHHDHHGRGEPDDVDHVAHVPGCEIPQRRNRSDRHVDEPELVPHNPIYRPPPTKDECFLGNRPRYPVPGSTWSSVRAAQAVAGWSCSSWNRSFNDVRTAMSSSNSSSPLAAVTWIRHPTSLLGASG